MGYPVALKLCRCDVHHYSVCHEARHGPVLTQYFAMAPKKEVPAVTPATVAAALSAATEPSQKLTALSQLTAAGASFSTPQAIVDLIQHGIPTDLVDLLQHTDKSIKLLACRQIASYAACGLHHPLQQAVASLTTTQVRQSDTLIAAL